MNEIPDRQAATAVDGDGAGHPLITIKHSDAIDVDITSAERWENADGSVFALVTREEWPRDGSGWESTP